MFLNCHRAPTSAVDAREMAAAGATWFELDVRLLSGELHVTHFVPFMWVPALEHNAWKFRRRPREITAPRLADVLAMIPEESGVLLDLKDDHGQAAVQLAKAVSAAPLDSRRVMASSKNWSSLTALSQTGITCWASASTRLQVRRLGDTRSLKVFGVTIRHRLITKALVESLHDRDLHVMAWTVNDPLRGLALRDLGVDGVTSDSPDVFRALTGTAAE